jgi:hypothetical protein
VHEISHILIKVEIAAIQILFILYCLACFEDTITMVKSPPISKCDLFRAAVVQISLPCCPVDSCLFSLLFFSLSCLQIIFDFDLKIHCL